MAEIDGRSISADRHRGDGAAAFRVQHQIRRNAQDMQEYLADLGSWEKSIKKKDRQLSRKAAMTLAREPVVPAVVPVAAQPVRRIDRPVAISCGPPPIDVATVRKSTRDHKGQATEESTLASTEIVPAHSDNDGPHSIQQEEAARTMNTKVVSPAGHTHDKGYGKWAKFDIDAALRKVDEEPAEEHGDSNESDTDEATLASPVTTVTTRNPYLSPTARANRSPQEDGRGESSRPFRMPVETAENQRDPEKEERERGNKMFCKGRFEGAINCYTRCLGINSKSVLASSNRAMAYLKLKEFGKAERDCDAALRLDPRHTKSLQRRAVARNALGKHRAALGDLQTAAEVDPNSKQIGNDVQKTLETLKAASRRAPKQQIAVEAEALPAVRRRSSPSPNGAVGAGRAPLHTSNPDVVSIVEPAVSDTIAISSTPIVASVAPMGNGDLSTSEGVAAPISSVVVCGRNGRTNANRGQLEDRYVRTIAEQLPDAIAEPEIADATKSCSSIYSPVATAFVSAAPGSLDADTDSWRDCITPGPPPVLDVGAACPSIAISARPASDASNLCGVSQVELLETTATLVDAEGVAGGARWGGSRSTGDSLPCPMQLGAEEHSSSLGTIPEVRSSSSSDHLVRRDVESTLPLSAGQSLSLGSSSSTTEQRSEQDTSASARNAAAAARSAPTAIEPLTATRRLPTTGYQLEHMWRSASASKVNPGAKLELLRAVPPSSIAKIFRRTPLEVELLEGILAHLAEAFLPERPGTAVRWLRSLAKASRFTMAVSLMNEAHGRQAARELVAQLETLSKNVEELGTIKKQYML